MTAQSDPAVTAVQGPRAEVRPSGLFGSEARQKLLAFASLILLLIYFSFASPAFMQTDNMINILQATAVNGVLAIASTFVIITAGIARKPGMSRDDLLNTNFKIMSDVVQKVVAQSPESILIIVSNPLDAMAQAAFRQAGFNRERVIGMAGVLDSARFRSFIAAELNVSVENVTAFVLGGHGDTMVPLARYSTVAGIPITELIAPERLEQLIQRTRDGGAEIVKHLKTGSAYYAPGAAAVEMAEAILKDKKKILPCAAYLEGEYGISGYFVGVPCKLGAGGLEQIVEIKLTPEEDAALKKSAAAVKELCAVIGV